MNEERGKRIEDKLDKVAEDVVQVKIEMTAIRKDVAYHIKRSDTLEEVVAPIHEFINSVKLISKIIGSLAVLAAIIEGVVTLLEYLKHVK